MSRCKSIGIVGTAKNTGKTTTLSYLLNNIHDKKICVTGIGYDGEEIDNITNLPKPRLFLSAGITTFTSEDCLKITSAKLILKERTGLFTPLGEIIKVEITEPGMLVVAGPNKQSDLENILGKNKNKFDLIFVDGSLNRLAPLSAVDEIIFTTGASRNIDPEVLSEEMRAIEKLFLFPIKKNEAYFINKNSLIDNEDLLQLISQIKIGINYFRVEKIIGYEFLKSLSEFLSERKNVFINLILPSPFSLLICGEPANIFPAIESIKNLKIYYQKVIALKAVSINPFFPKLKGNVYTNAWIDRAVLNNRMKEKLTLPVFDIKEDAKALMDIII